MVGAQSDPYIYAHDAQVMAELPGLRVLARDFQGRQDLRCTRVFSIDPPSARDLDDALSVTAHADGTFDVGVHIADVSHFVRRAAGAEALACLTMPQCLASRRYAASDPEYGRNLRLGRLQWGLWVSLLADSLLLVRQHCEIPWMIDGNTGQLDNPFTVAVRQCR